MSTPKSLNPSKNGTRTTARSREKVTKLHFYFQDVLGGEYPTVVKVAEASSTSNSTTNFGRISMLDDLLTVGPEPDSQKLGRAQGTIGFSDLSETSLQMVINLVFSVH
ncbi:Dirigent protein 2 [Abeliophyllum distichum]|uniref:Dirigent protein n=1 Tax=Abeliophyllum distichum TaxID=126358 RepID=A0ABD1RS59_9LAMI